MEKIGKDNSLVKDLPLKKIGSIPIGNTSQTESIPKLDLKGL
jgi:hypothetical protein